MKPILILAHLGHAYIEKPTHPKRVTVCYGFWSRGVIESFFFENEQIEAVTVNGDRYGAMLNEFLITKIKNEDIGNIWFQQDGTKSHTAMLVYRLEKRWEILRQIDPILAKKNHLFR